MDSEHRHFATQARLNAPISSYEIGMDENVTSNPFIPWPPAVTAKYQTKFVQGWVLNRAWQEIQNSLIFGLVSTVRNRILHFALELRTELGSVGDNINRLAPATVERTISNYIYKPQNVFAGSAQNVHQSATQVTVKEHDRKSGRDTFGDRTKTWLKALPGNLASGAVAMGTDVAKAAAKQWLMQYFGLDV